MSPKEKFISIIANDAVTQADAIILLEGDGFNRIGQAVALFHQDLAPVIVVSGGVVNPPHGYPASQMLPKLLEQNVPKTAIILEEKSQNTRDQAIEIITMCKEKGWKSIILVASHYHQYRAFLTFLAGMREAGLEIVIMNSPARDLAWFDAQDPQGRRIDLLEGEFKRIDEYSKKGHVATFEEGIEYLMWKESLGK